MGLSRFFNLVSKPSKKPINSFLPFPNLCSTPTSQTGSHRSFTTSLRSIKFTNFTRNRTLHTENPSGFLSNRTGGFYRAIHDGLGKTQVPDEASDKIPGANNREITEEAERICRILSSNSKSPIDSFLDGASVEVSPALVVEVLKKLSNAGVLALSFFRWAEKQKGFKHTMESYNALIEALGKIKQFKMIWELVNDMKSKGLLSKETFALISRRYSRAKKVKEAIETFEKMEKFGMKVEGSDFNRLIDTLGKSRQVGKHRRCLIK
ncbi:pentatricopeptide repeat-containing protein [Prunus yedoensis var. nudiflora]|uniref:Pentatricopeptide repeat-containing protein n=1 Tax=Prunus yedoensis var. nudiflora TaxID=2094558 RepID=A0A314YMJ0_PRUYE|nr:pentatricopeptide repeat-containing protein [Prunus yedoensis var. nudiflora]